MPRFLDPNQTFPLVLDSDAGKPEGERPTFTARVLNGHLQRQLLELSDKIQTAGSNLEAFTAIFDSLKVVIVGWENMIDPTTGEAIEFDPERFEHILGSDEAVQLLAKAREANELEASDLGKFVSPSSSSTDGSAKDAAPGDAPTLPASSSLPSSPAPPATTEAATQTTPAPAVAERVSSR